MASAAKLLSSSRWGTLRSVVRPQAFSTAAPAASAERGTYFGPFEVRDGVAIIRIDGPEKMNTLSDGALAEAEKLWIEKVEPDASIKAAVFISSKSDNFIAGADIQVTNRSFGAGCRILATWTHVEQSGAVTQGINGA